MSNLKILAAALCLVVATGAIGDVSAKTMADKTAPVAAVSKTTPVASGVSTKANTGKLAIVKHRRLHVAHRGTKSVKVARHATQRGKIAHKIGLTHVARAGAKGRTSVVR